MTHPSSLLTSTQTVQLSKSQRALLFASRQRQRWMVRGGGVLLLAFGLLIGWFLIPDASALQSNALGPLELLPPVFATAFFGLYGFYLMIRGKPSNVALAGVLLLAGVLSATVYFHARLASEPGETETVPSGPSI